MAHKFGDKQRQPGMGQPDKGQMDQQMDQSKNPRDGLNHKEPPGVTGTFAEDGKTTVIDKDT